MFDVGPEVDICGEPRYDPARKIGEEDVGDPDVNDCRRIACVGCKNQVSENARNVKNEVIR